MASTDRFGYEWGKYNYIISEYDLQFLKWIKPLDQTFFKDKTILDAGCGMGRNTYWIVRYGAKRAVAFDFDERSVAAARNTLREFPNASVVYADIEKFQTNERFDLVLSIGVIHHLKNPHAALVNLARFVKPGGKLLIWVYGYEGNEWIVRWISPLRIYITSRLPVGLVHILTYGFSIPLYLYVKLLPQRSAYLKQLRGFRFDHIHSIVFDHLIPSIANYYTRDEAQHLLSNLAELTEVSTHRVNNNSWTVTGIKSDTV